MKLASVLAVGGLLLLERVSRPRDNGRRDLRRLYPEWYHVTYIRDIPGIQEKGLRPGGPLTWEIYRARSRGHLFLSDPGSVYSWFGRKERMAEHRSDDLMEDLLVPAVLRYHRPLTPLLDELGTEDTLGVAIQVRHTLLPHDLSAWDGRRWRPLMSLDVDDLIAAVGVQTDIVDGEVLNYYDLDPLIPGDEALNLFTRGYNDPRGDLGRTVRRSP